MAEVQTGMAVVWGADQLEFSGVVIHTSGKMQEYNFERSHDGTELRDEVGDVVGMASVNRKRTLNITVMPSHDTALDGSATSAVGYANSLIAKPGTQVVVTDTTSSSVIDAANSGNYQVLSCKIRRTNNGAALIDFVLEAFDANDVTTAVSA